VATSVIQVQNTRSCTSEESELVADPPTCHILYTRLLSFSAQRLPSLPCRSSVLLPASADLRSSARQLLQEHTANTDFESRAFYFAAARIWNHLKLDTISAINAGTFKSLVWLGLRSLNLGSALSNPCPLIRLQPKARNTMYRSEWMKLLSVC